MKYKVLILHFNKYFTELEAELNELGEDGWDLVDVDVRSQKAYCIFKKKWMS